MAKRLFLVPRHPEILAAGLFALSAFSGLTTQAIAGDAGERDFPATLVVDEPQVESEIGPSVARGRNGANAQQTDFGFDTSVKLTPRLAVVVRPAFTILRPGGSGFQNVGTAIKYQFVTDAEHEFILSAALAAEFGHTGSPRVGADPFTTIIPTLFLGKGAGDLPEAWSWARPFAVTGQLALNVPTVSKSAVSAFGDDAGTGRLFQANPYSVTLSGSFQYSLVYAFENVPDLHVPHAFSELVPLVEFVVQVPVANNGARRPTIGTIDPGFLWCHDTVQIGLEALIPVNKASGTHPGFRVQLAYAFDTPWAD